jgi:peroxiredoxin family protein
MNITVTSNCQTLEIQSELVDAFMANAEESSLSVTLTTCDKTEYSYSISEEDITSEEIDDVTVYTLVLNSEDVAELEVFPETVLHVVLTFTNSENEIQKEVGCQLIGCELECRVYDYQSNNLDSNIFLYYQALLLGENCDQCNCKGMCDLLEKIESILASNSDNDCGCK